MACSDAELLVETGATLSPGLNPLGPRNRTAKQIKVSCGSDLYSAVLGQNGCGQIVTDKMSRTKWYG